MISSRKRVATRARVFAAVLGVGAFASLATAPASFAAGAGPKPPTVGVNCQTDGKISGEGSTFQTNAYSNAFIKGYTNDVCGPVGTATDLNSAYGSDPAGSNMVAYNYTNAITGSGNGLLAASCRADEFSGTDIPYSTTTLSQIFNAAPGTYATDNSKTCPTGANTPYFPNTNTFPNAAESSVPVMSFPVAGGAVAIATNLAGVCTSGPPSNLDLTANELDEIWQGTINQWNDPALVATDPALSTDGCSGPIQRVVREDNSGTTAILTDTLQTIDSATTCAGSTWAAQFDSSANQNGWPEGCVDVNDNVALNTTTATGSGSPALIAKVEATNGSIGYAELGLWGTLPAGTSFASIENDTGEQAYGLSDNTPPSSVFISPGSPGASSNCNIGVNGLPGAGGANDAVGLNSDNWAIDQVGSANKNNVTFQGSGFPVCGLTYDLVPTGFSETGEATPVTGASLSVSGPIIGITNDQQRTLYSFFTYIFSPLGQSYLAAQTYDQLPAAWLPILRTGFQDNF